MDAKTYVLKCHSDPTFRYKTISKKPCNTDSEMVSRIQKTSYLSALSW